jgi:hypothetical protein
VWCKKARQCLAGGIAATALDHKGKLGR